MLDLTKPLITSDGRAAVLLRRCGDTFSAQVAGSTQPELWFYGDGRPVLGSELLMGFDRFTIANAPDAAVTADVGEVVRKVLTGLRQVAGDMVGRGNRGVSVSSEEHGFDLEALPQYADRITGYARELADSIGYKQPSDDLLAARELVAEQVLATAKWAPGAIFMMVDEGGAELFRDDTGGTVARLRAGRADNCTLVVNALRAINKGRELAEADAQRQRIQDMLSAPREVRSVPDQLTITIDGPQGSGKTLLGEAMVREFPSDYRPLHKRGAVRLDPRIVEMREGRPFDVRNEVFLDGQEG